jgi:hypothetical protein
MPSGIAFAAVAVASGAGRKKKKLRKGMLLAALIIVMLAVLVSCGEVRRRQILALRQEPIT